MAINLSLSKLPWYGQVGAVVALAIAGAGVFWNWYAVPAQADIEQRVSQLQTIRAEVVRGQRTARELPEFRKRVTTLEAQLVDLSRQLPEEQDVADLLRRVQGMATESNLTIRGFTPQTVASKQLHIEWPIGLKLEGRYHDLGAFLERVSKFPRIINVGEIKIKGIDAPTGGATVTADCTATTFVMKDPIKPAGAALPPGLPGTPGATAPTAAKAAR